jgi:SSS family solute:Na+ symporter
VKPARPGFIARLLGYNDDFTRRDKLVAGGLVGWTFLLAAVSIIAAISNVAVGHWSAEAWSRYWLIVGVVVPMLVGFVTLIWFGIGGITDLRAFFIALRNLKRDANDDGRVPPQEHAGHL